MALIENGHPPSGDAFAPGGLFSLATPESNQTLAAGAGFTSVTVDELAGVMRFDGTDDHWTFNTALAGPVAEVVSSLDNEQLRTVRATLDPWLAPFERDGGLELPWLTVVTSTA